MLSCYEELRIDGFISHAVKGNPVIIGFVEVGPRQQNLFPPNVKTLHDHDHKSLVEFPGLSMSPLAIWGHFKNTYEL